MADTQRIAALLALSDKLAQFDKAINSSVTYLSISIGFGPQQLTISGIEEAVRAEILLRMPSILNAAKNTVKAQAKTELQAVNTIIDQLKTEIQNA